MPEPTPEATYHVPEPRHPARTVLASGSVERFDSIRDAPAYPKEQIEKWGKDLQELGRSPLPELHRRKTAAESFGAYVQFAISQWLVAGHPQPTHLYLGFAEREAMADATRHMATVADPRLPRTGKTMYHGLEVVRVDEPTFFRVG